MTNTTHNERILRSTLLSFFAGILFLLILFLLLTIRIEIPFSLQGFKQVHHDFPYWWILDLLPFFLAATYWKVSTYWEKKVLIFQKEIEQEKNKSNLVHGFISGLIHEKEDSTYQIPQNNDKLFRALIDLRDNLKKKNEEAKIRKQEDDQRNWVAEGLAKFGEILRKHNDNMEELSHQVLSNLVKYLKANQGGFFILNDNNPNEKYFEQTACYAYDRKKFADKRIEWGEGLIGTCALEKKTIFLTSLPDSYVSITSGLGKSNPNALLIVPLLINEEIHGMIEIASFYKFEPYQVKFVEKVAESIASTISSLKINIRTSKLLKATQEQAEILASQEEQMRQNMEELQATQEEAARQGEKLASFTNAVNHTLIRAEYATDGTLIYANTKFLHKLGYSGNIEVEGKHISMFISPKDLHWFEPLWDGLAKGGRHFEGDMKHVTKQGQDLWTIATYTCMRKDDGSVEKVLFLAIDTTDQKKQSLDYEGQIDALNRSSIKAIYSPSGELLEYNPAFIEALKYSELEIKDSNFYTYIDQEEHESFKQTWERVIQGVPFMGVLKFRIKQGDIKWFRGTLTAVNDMYGEVAKVIFISNDITREKLMEIETRKQTEQLMIQEEKLRQSGEELQKKLEQARNEMKLQFQEIEKIKIRNERTLEGALDAIVTIDHFGTIEFFNRAAEELWGFERKAALGNNVKMLFSEDVIKNDDFVSKYVEPGENKIVGVRKEVKITNASGSEVPVLFLISEAKLGDEHSYTAFIQNIEVELF